MGLNHVAARLAFDNGVNVATAVAARSLVTAIGVSLLVLSSYANWQTTGRQRRGLLIVGLLIGVQSQLLYGAVSRLPVALALIAFNTFPLWTALWDRLLYGRVADRVVIKALPVLLLGLCLALDVVGASSAAGARAHLDQIGIGVGLAVLAAALFGVALVVMQHETAGLDGRVRTIATLVLVGAVASFVMTLQGGPHLPHNPQGWYALAALTLLYGTGFTMLSTVLPKLGVGNHSAIMNAEPIFALIGAWLLLGQTIAVIQVIGALIVMTTVIWLGLHRR